jgi:hypothetical protein
MSLLMQSRNAKDHAVYKINKGRLFHVRMSISCIYLQFKLWAGYNIIKFNDAFQLHAFIVLRGTLFANDELLWTCKSAVLNSLKEDCYPESQITFRIREFTITTHAC